MFKSKFNLSLVSLALFTACVNNAPTNLNKTDVVSSGKTGKITVDTKNDSGNFNESNSTSLPQLPNTANNPNQSSTTDTAPDTQKNDKGSVNILWKGFNDSFKTQATSEDIAQFEIILDGPGIRTVNNNKPAKQVFTPSQTGTRIRNLPPGEISISLTALDNLGKQIGATRVDGVQIRADQETKVRIALQLIDTIINETSIAPVGHLEIGITVADGQTYRSQRKVIPEGGFFAFTDQPLPLPPCGNSNCDTNTSSTPTLPTLPELPSLPTQDSSSPPTSSTTPVGSEDAIPGFPNLGDLGSLFGDTQTPQTSPSLENPSSVSTPAGLPALPPAPGLPPVPQNSDCQQLSASNEMTGSSLYRGKSQNTEEIQGASQSIDKMTAFLNVGINFKEDVSQIQGASVLSCPEPHSFSLAVHTFTQPEYTFKVGEKAIMINYLEQHILPSSQGAPTLEFLWETSDSSIASLGKDKYSNYTFLKPGRVTVTSTVKNYGNVKATTYINVVDQSTPPPSPANSSNSAIFTPPTGQINLSQSSYSSGSIIQGSVTGLSGSVQDVIWFIGSQQVSSGRNLSVAAPEAGTHTVSIQIIGTDGKTYTPSQNKQQIQVTEATQANLNVGGLAISLDFLPTDFLNIGNLEEGFN